MTDDEYCCNDCEARVEPERPFSFDAMRSRIAFDHSQLNLTAWIAIVPPLKLPFVMLAVADVAQGEFIGRRSVEESVIDDFVCALQREFLRRNIAVWSEL